MYIFKRPGHSEKREKRKPEEEIYPELDVNEKSRKFDDILQNLHPLVKFDAGNCKKAVQSFRKNS